MSFIEGNNLKEKVEDRVDGILTFHDLKKKKFKGNSSEKKDEKIKTRIDIAIAAGQEVCRRQ